ncbi:Hypothetical protein CM240_3365 [Clostridium bornimense]|uniref:DUF3784 domain-containing protein n=1 Tax=Clostridium bornimense TaxID=1216932 RepID=W6S7V3_9CLOT|nr:hypothetical protein [Clostridium bornimense]CDM70482.1 Hypothetical protein CM240_3365 [Clostridium bornimense]
MNNTTISFLIFTIIIGISFLLFGYNMKKNNEGNLIIYFNERKHNREKVSTIVGNMFIKMGLSILIIGLITLFFKNSIIKYSVSIQCGIAIIGTIKSTIDIDTKCRL